MKSRQMFKLITTGFFYADGGAMFGTVPKATWKRIYPVDSRNLCVLAMHTGVIKTETGRVIIIDPGVGVDFLQEAPAKYYHFHNTVNLCGELQKTGIMPEEVSDVIFTHLHFDHCLGAIRKNAANLLEPAFPNASHWLSRTQYENQSEPHPLEAGSFTPQNINVLEKAGLVRIVESATEPCERVNLKLYDGHTPGQIVVSVETESIEGKRRIVFPGDVIPLSSHVVPERISAYDNDRACSYNGKIEILENFSSGNDIFVFYHDSYTPCAIIKKIVRLNMQRFKVTPFI